ncbi:thermonuclease family protein [Microvirga aerilata]|jgi:endonuclease YncB( thermonuclease family)|uniref:Thermonuclease family protein n=1 Tax=Microvirga aerilata TaxID=670292 RepID=A0A936ZBH3_9HYPH|nr:thermonuclease family protein [Microvirga aerilata]MBL0407691.1 thermonuclease family protein [Microvirga aerilata]
MKTAYLIFAGLIVSATPVLAEPLVGRASVIDGDTLDIRGTRIRLHGVDAPESAQMCQSMDGQTYRCGQKAALALSDKIATANVSCEQKDTDRYQRIVAVCSVKGEDLNAWLVEEGYALAYRQYGTEYVSEEDKARARKRGIWAGTFTYPWDWRRGKRDNNSSAGIPILNRAAEKTAERPDCKIKGNINQKGDRIYHLPGSRDYERTVLNVAAGERWFCSEEEATGAGWRAPRR